MVGEDKKYRLTLRLMELGNAALSDLTLQQVVDPFLISKQRMLQKMSQDEFLKVLWQKSKAITEKVT